MPVLAEFQVEQGCVTEAYTVEMDTPSGDVFIRCVWDAEDGGPSDVLHVDSKAIRRLALALTLAAQEATPISDDRQNVIALPRVRKFVPGSPVWSA